MVPMAKQNHDPDWAEAKRHCSGKVLEFRNAVQPWPDHTEIPDLPPCDDPYLAEDSDVPFDEAYRDHGPPEEEEIDEENCLMLRQQCRFRWAAQAIAVFWSEVPEVRKVAAFGAAAEPLIKEVPRFRQFRRHGVEVFHECADLDMAVWLTRLDELKSLKRAMGHALALVEDAPYGGVAHHQVDVHVFDAAGGDYRGRLCFFGQCPKAGKRECFVRGCGERPFLRQFADYRFRPAQFDAEPKVILFDRARNFLTSLPRIEGLLRVVKTRRPDDDVPF